MRRTQRCLRDLTPLHRQCDSSRWKVGHGPVVLRAIRAGPPVPGGTLAPQRGCTGRQRLQPPCPEDGSLLFPVVGGRWPSPLLTPAAEGFASL